MTQILKVICQICQNEQLSAKFNTLGITIKNVGKCANLVNRVPVIWIKVLHIGLKIVQISEMPIFFITNPSTTDGAMYQHGVLAITIILSKMASNYFLIQSLQKCSYS